MTFRGESHFEEKQGETLSIYFVLILCQEQDRGLYFVFSLIQDLRTAEPKRDKRSLLQGWLMINL